MLKQIPSTRHSIDVSMFMEFKRVLGENREGWDYTLGFYYFSEPPPKKL